MYVLNRFTLDYKIWYIFVEVENFYHWIPYFIFHDEYRYPKKKNIIVSKLVPGRFLCATPSSLEYYYSDGYTLEPFEPRNKFEQGHFVYKSKDNLYLSLIFFPNIHIGEKKYFLIPYSIFPKIPDGFIINEHTKIFEILLLRKINEIDYIFFKKEVL